VIHAWHVDASDARPYGRDRAEDEALAVHPGKVDLKNIIVDRDFSIDQTRALRPELMTIV
jgi:hypothetical protein